MLGLTVSNLITGARTASQQDAQAGRSPKADEDEVCPSMQPTDSFSCAISEISSQHQGDMQVQTSSILAEAACMLD
jgi:hypothetical protein